MTSLQCADTSSSSTTYTCTTSPSLGSLTAGDTFIFTAINQNNSGSSTLNIDSIGAKTIKKWQNTANLASGDLQAGASILLTYDGTYLEASTIGNAPSGGVSAVTGPPDILSWVCSGGTCTASKQPQTANFVWIAPNSGAQTPFVRQYAPLVYNGSSVTISVPFTSVHNRRRGFGLHWQRHWRLWSYGLSCDRHTREHVDATRRIPILVCGKHGRWCGHGINCR